MKITPIKSQYITNYFKNNFKQQKLNTLSNDIFQKTCSFKGQNCDLIEQDNWIILGYDGWDLTDEKNKIRYRLLMGTKEGDLLMIENTSTNTIPIQNAQYKLLEKKFLSRNGNYVCPFFNIEDTPDYNGVRGKNPLIKTSIKGVEKKLDALKKCNIRIIIDLRDKEACNKKVKDLVIEKGLEYFNLPVEEISSGNCDIDFLDTLTQYFEIINEGDFFIGCANGESRTDLALGINYVCNKKAKNIPILKWLHTGNHDTNLKNNMKIINKLISQNPEYVKNWGWQNYEEYKKESAQRLKNVYENNKRKN